jgi:alpha-1,2-mannosyltransferase
MASGPLFCMQWLLRSQATTKQTVLRTFVFLSPFYMWLAIFTLQPHKEERFMYPAYPFLGLNAAIALHMILAYLRSSNPAELIGRIPAKLKLFVVVFPMILSVDVGLLRTIGMITAYSAPLKIYSALEKHDLARAGETVCLGKEWYRFPSSYFLPNGMHAKFVRSEFDGLLPGEFNEGKVGFGFFAGTWLVPPGMNDENRGDPGKYVGVLQACSSTNLTIGRSISVIVRSSSILTF